LSGLPVLSSQDAVRAFIRLGYAIDHQTDSHIILRQQQAPYRRLTVPDHGSWPKECCGP
jgi:predicted RNA binding protein YcfA (HicA-like mRNA interferase family)